MAIVEPIQRWILTQVVVARAIVQIIPASSLRSGGRSAVFASWIFEDGRIVNPFCLPSQIVVFPRWRFAEDLLNQELCEDFGTRLASVGNRTNEAGKPPCIPGAAVDRNKTEQIRSIEI